MGKKEQLLTREDIKEYLTLALVSIILIVIAAWVKAMCLGYGGMAGMVGMAVMPAVGVGKLGYYILCSDHNSVLQAYGATDATVRGIGWSVFTASGWAAWGIGFACSVGAVY